jgi:hypothetical protein
VQPGAGDLAGGEEVPDVRLAAQVGADAAARVVGGRDHGDRLGGDVDPVLQAALRDVGEALPDEVRRHGRAVQVGAVVAGALQLCVDGARHHVAGRQVRALVVARHEALSGGVAQHRPLAADRLADQEAAGLGVVEAGRVELDELHVHDGGPRPVGHGDAVSRRDLRVAGVDVDLAAAPGGQQGQRRANPPDLAALLVEQVGTDHPGRPGPRQLLGGHQVHGQDVSEDLDPGVVLAAGHQHPLDLLAGEVGRVEHTTVGVATLPAQVEARPGAARIEVDSQLEEALDRVGPALHHESHHPLVTEPRSGPQGVLHVGLEGVAGVHHCGDAPLGVVGGGLGGALLGDDDDAPHLGRAQGEAQAGDPTAENQEVAVTYHAVAARPGRGSLVLALEAREIRRLHPTIVPRVVLAAPAQRALHAQHSASAEAVAPVAGRGDLRAAVDAGSQVPLFGSVHHPRPPRRFGGHVDAEIPSCHRSGPAAASRPGTPGSEPARLATLRYGWSPW